MSNAAHHTFETPEQLHAWLKTNHASETELWVRIFKSYRPAQRDVGRLRGGRHFLGWIDGIRKSLDDTSFLQRLTPRRARSNWSQKNVQHAERLITRCEGHAAASFIRKIGR